MTIRITHIIDLDELMNKFQKLSTFNEWYETTNDGLLQIVFISSKSALSYENFVQWIFDNTPCHVDSGEPDVLIFTDRLYIGINKKIV